MMISFKKFVCAISFAILLCGSVYAGPVIINGKTLDKVDDIVVETTGARVIEKSSFLKFMKANDGNLRFYPVKISEDEGISQEDVFSLNEAGGFTNTGLHPAAGTKRNSDGSLVLMSPYSDENGIHFSFYNVTTNENNKLVCTKQDWNGDIKIDEGRYAYITDSTGGLFRTIDNGKETFILAYYTAPAKSMPSLEAQKCKMCLALISPEKKSVDVMALGSEISVLFPSVRVVAGDLNNDGTSDEFAYITDTSQNPYFFAWCTFNESLDFKFSDHVGTRDANGEKVDGCDVVFGDFDGDKKNEVAVVCTGAVASKFGTKTIIISYPNVKIYSCKDGKFTSSETVSDSTLPLSSTNSDTTIYGLTAEAGDIDGDECDEIVFLSDRDGNFDELYISVWGTDKNLKPYQKFLKGTEQSLYGYKRDERNYLLRSASLALVNLAETSQTVLSLRQKKIFFSLCEDSDKIFDNSWYSKLWHMNYQSSGLSSPILDNSEKFGGKIAMTLLPADFYNESISLEEPTHLVFETEKSYAAIIQTPPYHVDYVLFPFKVNGEYPQNKSVLNMSYTGSNVTYSKSTMDSDKNDVSFSTTSSLEWGVNANASGQFKLISGTLSGGYKDTSIKVASESNSSQKTITTSISDSTDASDNIVLYKTDRHVWRYPVLNSKNLEQPDESNGDCFMTFSLCDEPDIIQGSAGHSAQFDDYNPAHEEGNLFSYPTKLENIEYYSSMQQALSQQISKTIGGTTNFELNVSDVVTDILSLTTKSKKAINGSVGVSLGKPTVLKAGIDTSASYNNELANTETFTKSYQESEKFTVSLKSGTLLINISEVAYLITAQIYADIAGIMKAAFAVDLTDSNAPVWGREMYNNKPDPSLVLPARYERVNKISDSGVALTIWTANEYCDSAIQIRGISFYDNDNEKITTSVLTKGTNYRITIPVYNASFKSAGNVQAVMLLRSDNEKHDFSNLPDLKKMTTLDQKTTNLDGWTKDSEANKAVISFEWTVPSDIEAGNYDLYFMLDPDNSIDELHESWNYKEDPGGNNVGRYPIAILDSQTVASASTIPQNFTASVSEKDFKIYFKPLRADDTHRELTIGKFREEVDKLSEDVRAYARIVYSGTETLTNLFMTAYKITNGEKNRIASRTIPALFPNYEHNVSFIISPKTIKDSSFALNLTGDNVNLHWPDENKDDSNNNHNTPPLLGSGGGCNTGTGIFLLMLLFCRLKNKHDR